MAGIVVITGFEPFGGDSQNPSSQIVKILDGTSIDGYSVIGIELPVDELNANKIIENYIIQYKPKVVISIGLAWGRVAISIERIGINIKDYPIADNYYHQPQNIPIDNDGPDGLFTSLPIRAIVKGLRDAGIPSYVSNTAGTYLCNQVLYGTLNYIRKNDLDIKAGFLHIPFSSSQVAQKGEIVPTLPMIMLEESIRIAIGISLTVKSDIDLTVGAIN